MRILRITVAAALAAGAAVAGGLAAAAAPASADVPPSEPIQYVTKFVHGTTNQKVLGTLGCPTGTFVVSASADHAGITSLTPASNSRSAQGLANFTVVAATGYPEPDGSGGAAFIEIQAACAPASRLSNAVSRSITVAAGDNNSNARRAVVYCPAGMRAFGGGGYFLTTDNHCSNAASGLVENTVTAAGTGWTVRAYTTAATDRLIVTTHCAPLAGSYIPQAGVRAPPFSAGYVSARCAIGYTVLSGGVTFVNPNNTEGSGVVFSSWTSAGGVGVNGYAVDDSLLTARAQCVPPGSF